MKITNYLSVGIVAMFLVIFGVGIIKTNFGSSTVNAEVYSRACSIQSISPVNIGHQLSTQILATTSNRAYARIQIPDNATNTVRLAFGGSSATASNGIIIGGAITNGATSTPFIEFGLNTDFPFVGAVQGLTDNGSTTVDVTTCIY